MIGSAETSIQGAIELVSEECESREVMSPGDAIDALQDVVEDFDRYALAWFQRLSDGLVSENSMSASDRELRARVREFREEKRKWQAKREVQHEEIQESMRLLTEAWLRLEDEQRQLQQQRDASESPFKNKISQNGANRPTQVGNAGHAMVNSSATSSCVPVNPGVTVPASNSVPHATDRESMSSGTLCVSELSDAAVRQFQQLRIEIESSRLRPVDVENRD